MRSRSDAPGSGKEDGLTYDLWVEANLIGNTKNGPSCEDPFFFLKLRGQDATDRVDREGCSAPDPCMEWTRADVEAYP